jgi:Spy/CpxP family protein refolding chaperone
MKARNIILTIAAVAILAAPATALAQRGSGGGPGWHGDGMGGDHLGFFERRLPRMAEELGLSDEQLEKIQAIADAARPEIEKYAEQLRNGRETYRAEHGNPAEFDESTFRAHAQDQHLVQTELMVVVAKARAEIFAQLTPEQIEQLEEMRGSFNKRAFRRGGGRRSGSSR